MPVLSQCLTGLATASPLFLLAAGFTLSADVTRAFNVSHGSLAMLGAYVAWSILTRVPSDPASITLGVIATVGIIALLGAALHLLILRHLAQFPQLLATLGALLIVQDSVTLLWGPHALAFDRPIHELILIAIGPLVLAALLLLNRTRWGSLVRAATVDPETLRALGVDPHWLFTSVTALAAGLAGLAGALNQPGANPGLDVAFLTNAIVVALIGGLGSITGAYLAALVIGLLQAFGIDFLPEASPLLAFAILAVVLIIRPYGLLGRPKAQALAEPTLIRPAPLSVRLLFALALLGAIAAPLLAGPTTLSLMIEALIAILFAAGLHVMMGPGGMPNLGHAAFFGIGAYAAVLLVRGTGADMSLALFAAPLIAGFAALFVGALIVRLPSLYIAMLTLVFAQLVWTLAIQIGSGEAIRPAPWATPPMFYWLALTLCIGVTLLLRHALYGPFGYALRAIRDNPVRAAAIGLPTYLLRLTAFTLAGTTAGLAGGLTAFNQGNVSLADLTIAKSAEPVLMLLLGGIETISGPIVGAIGITGLRDAALGATTYWRLILGLALIALVLLFPQGIAGNSIRAWRRAP